MESTGWVKSSSLGNRPQPIDQEVDWDKSLVIMSETDQYGNIIDVNQTFVNVSGYTQAELLGQPQSIIRHPDMPQIIFKALWDNLKSGNNFIGIIKNMAKSGKYYWIFTDFQFLTSPSGERRYVARRAAVPESVIKEHIQPLYESLLKLEKIGGMELSSRFFKNYLKRQGKSYFEYVVELIENGGASISSVDSSSDNHQAPQENDISNDIYSVNTQKDEDKRKDLFSKFFS